MLHDICDFLGVDQTFIPDMTHRYEEARFPKNLALHAFISRPHALKRVLAPLVPLRIRHSIGTALRQQNLTTPPALDPTLRRELTAYFREDIMRLQALIDRDLSHWLE
jgi:hypothetical protein